MGVLVGCVEVGIIVDGGMAGNRNALSQLGDGLAEFVDFVAHLAYHLPHGKGLEQQFAVRDSSSVPAGIASEESGHLFLGYVAEVVLKYGTCNGALFLDNGNLFSHILQFAYVAVPRIVHQIFAGIVGEKDVRHVVLLGHVG